ncbi:hypothetical protein K470DRAFT_242998 [Piedraia hortae CBS 480.64]|uniref:TPR-like protein n=1 Tax=Piedraia hortae CBS 480.64 TaxID=1314780 RepID=A0A6A7C4U9_9PEZI|nr:hypothetical protein K470DRAFT_242998 [Piedraia hortae CBS 480.64]
MSRTRHEAAAMSALQRLPTSEKGKRYLSQLSQALCDARWNEVSELARKTEKHAPERKCFTIAARTESLVNSAPANAAASAALKDSISQLQHAINEAEYPEDVYCARICLAEVHWSLGDASATLEELPPDSPPETNVSGLMNWLEACEAKRRYLRVAALETLGQAGEAQELYQVVPQTVDTGSMSLRLTNERLLARTCLHQYALAQPPTLPALNAALISFRAWASFWQQTTPAAEPSRTDIPRRKVWKAYYHLLSVVLQHRLLYSPSGTLTTSAQGFSDEQFLDARIRQRSELKSVETVYESLLLSETRFPKAEQRNLEAEEWTELAVANWSILCGPHWTDAELGEGGKEAVGRGVLDILYRATTKTFHSTAILRRLSAVHAALGDFELASHAFDSYAGIINRGMARTEKTGKIEEGLDDNDTAIQMAAAAMCLLCEYGNREQVEKAMGLMPTMESWLDQATEYLRTTIAAAYRAMGTTQACWARLTYNADSRLQLFQQAANNLKLASQSDSSVASAYSLARVLAETRDSAAAIDVIEQCIQPEMSRDPSMLPLWHLFILCLVAEEEHEAAVKTCNLVLDEVGRIEDDLQKEAVIQIKMSQLLLIELMEGPEASVDYCPELMALYLRLFGKPQPLGPQSRAASVNATPPSRAGSRLRSLTDNIRPRSVRSAGGRRPGSAHPKTRDSDGSGETVPGSQAADIERHHHHHLHLPFHQSRGRNRDSWRHRGLSSKRSVENLNDGTNGANKPSTSDIQAGAVQSSLAEGPSPQQPLKNYEHNHVSPEGLPAPTGHIDQPPEQDIRLPAPYPSKTKPMTKYNRFQEHSHHSSVLIETWLFTARLYLRAGLIEDARGATAEATSVVTSLENEVISLSANAQHLFSKTWGSGSSIDALWASIYTVNGEIAQTEENMPQAVSCYERALFHSPDYPDAIIKISEILLDSYEGTASETTPPTDSVPPAWDVQNLRAGSAAGSTVDPPPPNPAKSEPFVSLSQVAARDRACMLLSMLTKLGCGWDSSDAWYTLARAYELSGRPEKATQALWWTVRLEECKTLRGWSCLPGRLG